MVANGRSPGGRVAIPTAAVAVIGSALAVVVNLATEWKTNLWVWAGVAGVTCAAAIASWWLHKAQNPPSAPEDPPPVTRSVLGTTFNSTVITGDGNRVNVD
jgi:hypothetical protein